METLCQSEQSEQNHMFGDLLTANLHQIAKGGDSVTLQNYYDPALPQVVIPLNLRQTPA